MNSSAIDVGRAFAGGLSCHSNFAARLLAVAILAAAGAANLRAQINYEPYTVTTLAGSSLASGTADGTGAAARFNQPYFIALDSTGNAFVSDTYNHTIRKITPAGVVTTYTGLAGVGGTGGTTLASARFNFPLGMAFDPSGNLYVVDNGGLTVRKITPAGVVSTFAGNNVLNAPITDGSGNAARFNSAYGIASDATGTLYVTEVDDHVIRKVTPAGIVTTFVGAVGVSGSSDGTGTAARLNTPGGVSCDSAGNLYVGDILNRTVRKVTPAGVVTTIAGGVGIQGHVDATGTAARFAEPYATAVDSFGYIYVADAGTVTIRRIAPTGVVTTLAGASAQLGSVDGTGSAARFRLISGIAVDSHNRFFVVDTTDNTIRVGAPQPTRLSALAVRSFAGSGDSTLIAGLVVAGGATESVILRGVGPNLALQGVVGALDDPQLGLYSGSTLIAQNNDWFTTTPSLSTAFASVGLAPLPANSKDAALLSTLTAGAYTAQVTSTSGTGIALIEAYEQTVSAQNRLSALAVRSSVGTGANILIVGVVITGAAPKSLLVRGLGPTLAQQGVGGAMTDPKLELYNGSTLVASNDDWGGGATLSSAFSSVGLGALTANSKDAALLVNLLPGVYTFQLSGVNSTTGVGLIELYEIQ